MTTEQMIIKTLSNRRPQGVEITPSPKKSRIIEYEQIDGPKKYHKIPKNIDKWKTPSFVSYARRLYRERYGVDWDLNYTSSCQEILKLRDSFVDILGKCDNKMLAEFIDWFFDYHVDEFVNRKNGFFLNNLRQDWVVDNFIKHYQAKNKRNKKISTSVDKKNEDLTYDRINAVYFLSEERFVSEFGIVIAVNWLLKYEQKSPKEAAYFVYKVLDKLNKQDKLKNAIYSTEKNSPYPPGLKFLSPQWLVNKIDPQLKVKIKINDKHSSDFLKSLL